VRHGDVQRVSKSFSVAKYGTKEKALEAATSWVQQTRSQLHGEFTNHGDN